jgi:ABC transporter substrate binding protein
VRLIAALGGSAPPLAAQRTTATIPIVFSSGEVDPVKSGLVVSLNRPGGNVTGVSPMTGLLTAKRLEQLHEMMPNAAVIGYLANFDNRREPAGCCQQYRHRGSRARARRRIHAAHCRYDAGDGQRVSLTASSSLSRGHALSGGQDS